MRRAVATVGIAGALAVAAAAPASAAPAWYDGEAAVPASVQLHAVAAYRPAGAADDVVVAVGRDSDSKQAVVYRRVGGTWQRDAVASLPDDSCLASVAVTPQAAWAVGTQGGNCGSGTGGLIVRFPVEDGGLDSAASASWQVVPNQLGRLASVALSGAGGYLAAATGGVYSLTDGPSPTITALDSTPSASEVGAVAAYGSGGFAVGESAPAAGVRVFSLDSSHATPAPASASAPPTAVAALSPSAAIAVEGTGEGTPCTAENAPAYLYPSGGVWKRAAGDASFPAGSDLRGAAMAGSEAAPTEAIAGAVPDANGDCHGYVWSRTGNPATTGGWERSAALGPALSGVAVVASDDLWAAGRQGTVLHYFDKPPPPPPPDDPPADKKDPPDSGNGPPPSAPPPHVVVQQPPPPRSAPQPNDAGHGRAPRRLLSHVRVRVERGRLIVSFRLSAPARVKIQARAHGHLVGPGRTRVFAAGRRRMVVRYRGKRPPTQLRIVVRPVRSAA